MTTIRFKLTLKNAVKHSVRYNSDALGSVYVPKMVFGGYDAEWPEEICGTLDLPGKATLAPAAPTQTAKH